MTLLESIIRAAADANAGNLPPLSKFPIVFNSDAIIPNLMPIDNDSSLAVIHRVSGWKISDTDTEIADLGAQFSKTLKRALKNFRSLDRDRDEFLVLLSSFLAKNAERIRLSVGSDPSRTDFAPIAIEKMGFLISREVAGLVAEGSVVLGLWEVLEALIVHGLVGNLNPANLVEKLVEKDRPELLCLCVKHIPNLRSSDLVFILKCFLSPSAECYRSMIGLRKQWESQALLAVEKAAAKKGVPRNVSELAKEASILLMMAHDGFSSSELCLHYVFSSSNLDGIVLASAISRLDGSEVLGLVRYSAKWLEKYQRFPEAVPCPSMSSVLGLRACESIPSLEAVVSRLGLVFDGHYPYLVLNSEYHDQRKAIEKVVDSLASEAGACCHVDDIVKHLQSEMKQHGDTGV